MVTPVELNCERVCCAPGLGCLFHTPTTPSKLEMDHRMPPQQHRTANQQLLTGARVHGGTPAWCIEGSSSPPRPSIICPCVWLCCPACEPLCCRHSVVIPQDHFRCSPQSSRDAPSPVPPNDAAVMIGSGSCWAAAVLLLLAMGAAAAEANVTLSEDLDSKPLLEQLLSRKAFLREHLKTAEWRK